MLFAGLIPKKIPLARALSCLIAFILVLLPFHEFLAVWLGSNVGHLDLIRIWKEILIALMVPPALWLAWRIPALRRWLLNSWVARLYGGYILLHIGLGIWALAAHRVVSSALIYGLLINLRFIGFFLICAVVAAHDDFLKKYWARIVLGPAALTIIFGLLQRLALPYNFLRHFGYGPGTIPAYETVDNNLAYQRIGSTLRGANPFGAYLVLIITAAAGVLKNQSMLKPLYILAAMIALFYTYSRSAWIGVLLALAFLAYAGSRRLNGRLAYLALALVIILAGGLYVFRGSQGVQKAVLHTSRQTTSPQSSNAERGAAERAGLKSIIKHPLGLGPGTAGPASTRNSGHAPRIAEDYYIQIGQEVGVIGLGLFLAINCAVAARLWRRRAELLPQLLLASWIGISFINLVSHAWADDTLSLLWWGLAGIALAPAILLA